MIYQEAEFQRALPVWEDGKETEVNHRIMLEAICPAGEQACLSVAGHTAYSVFVNGIFVSYGPARAGRGHYRVDRIDLSSYLDCKENRICIISTGFYCRSYEWILEPSFVCAEILFDGEVIAATGGEGWRAYRCHEHLQRVQRYSGQRTFCEAFDYRRAPVMPLDVRNREKIVLSLTSPKHFIEREVPFPDFECEGYTRILEVGTTVAVAPDERRAPGHLNPTGTRTGFARKTCEVDSFALASGHATIPSKEEVPTTLPCEIAADGYVMLGMAGNRTGLIEVEVECLEDADVLLTFDEILVDGKIDFLRMSCINAMVYRLRGGNTYRLITAEPYTFQYVNVISLGGKILLKNLQLRCVGFPRKDIRSLLDEGRADAEIARIYHAAVETFCQNTLDVYMDCPSRERAGWLCDSFFTSRVEYLLSGESRVEHAFLSNFLMASSFEGIPKKMLPMCYPADDAYGGQFIPNWAMWFFLEAEEYLLRTGDRAMINDMRCHAYGLLEYFRNFENADGLLEDLDGWIFVEWSRCNDLVQSVNYPTNMLYYRFKRILASLYGDETLEMEAARLREVIRARSRKGLFFCDHSVKDGDGRLTLSDEVTETCQYYAFFMGVASREEDAELWETMVRDFGPSRRENNLHPHVHFSNAFVGNYLRLELLSRAGLLLELEENIRGYFDYMARRTDTLWENDSVVASCDHGFASHVLIWLKRLGYM